MQQAVFLHFTDHFPSADEIARRVEERIGLKVESKLHVATAHHWLLSFAPNGQWNGIEAAEVFFNAREKRASVELDSPPTKMQAAIVAALEAAGGVPWKG
ncbi:MAG: hypothetical protein F9K40_09845 [Kofleriaceae bacterium]|nr:MAG: hypothetical protein F9K40_09845 [Kofleriaceae bacterium]MBZ0237752.1 hypothetical protein [Kofleriaceae bacterium]